MWKYTRNGQQYLIICQDISETVQALIHIFLKAIHKVDTVIIPVLDEDIELQRLNNFPKSQSNWEKELGLKPRHSLRGAKEVGPQASETLWHCCQDIWGKDNTAARIHPRERISRRQEENRGSKEDPMAQGCLAGGSTEPNSPHISVRKSIFKKQAENLK